MNKLGIIAEYNPFHNGHAYQIKTVKYLSGADRVVIAMSGNFVQRGAPAILDKYKRTAMALANGADFVFEIPTVFATASAEYFAAAGIALLDALGCSAVCFGCETPDLALLSCTADILENEPDNYKAALSSYLKCGLSFPTARKKALLDYLKEPETSVSAAFTTYTEEDLTKLLDSPNNILALEYLKAIRRSHSKIRPIPILRCGAGYHDTALADACCSASAIRNYLLCAPDNSPFHPAAKEKLSGFVPDSSLAYLSASNSEFITEQDFSQMLYYKLLCHREQGFHSYADGSADLSNRIVKALPYYRDYRSFCELLKTREITYSRISRLLLHILLDITKEELDRAKDLGFAPYLRLLGFQREAADLFEIFRTSKKSPLITRPAKADRDLDREALSLFQKDIFASDLYYGILTQKSGQTQKPEYRRALVIPPDLS